MVYRAFSGSSLFDWLFGLLTVGASGTALAGGFLTIVFASPLPHVIGRSGPFSSELVGTPTSTWLFLVVTV